MVSGALRDDIAAIGAPHGAGASGTSGFPAMQGKLLTAGNKFIHRFYDKEAARKRLKV
ncbi:hypothetical protein Pmar_PMAR018042 [Perkinsus marinus ATCC 50983]|uniref:Uncharacterized protein n=1 Tax=Perkinsus marinus (strain ATCC 50983 / TXsc) TaxID=423536 RepID=C5KRU5_PERM5|nr:hypothetical protein Pmar_PMAR018042 [Perkinsus marinus ATCC 50983]EER12786.1 hypothetical protein Pmar_PMAR018042 [Perkinsus marinus ATCC 50983]|eukprot:XP_002780991.1 hypothetical protein Pmar_PMAR018042 [Perkinsus marinus ATCC 50983]